VTGEARRYDKRQHQVSKPGMERLNFNKTRGRGTS